MSKIDEFSESVIGQDMKTHYGFDCPGCGKSMNAKPSIGMELGFNSGIGICPDCNHYFSLHIDDKNERMIAVSKLDNIT